MEIDGACLCGYVTFEATIDPERVLICHCTDCQNGAGAFRTGVLVDAEKFRLLTGQPKVFVKTAESGNKRALSFCPECGTSIHGASVADPKTYSLRLGIVRQRGELVPRAQIWCRSALAWVDGIGSIRKFDTQPRLIA